MADIKAVTVTLYTEVHPNTAGALRVATPKNEDIAQH